MATLLFEEKKSLIITRFNAYKKPEQAALTSRQDAYLAPIFFCTRQAVFGISAFPVIVASRIISTCSAEIPASSSAANAAYDLDNMSPDEVLLNIEEKLKK